MTIALPSYPAIQSAQPLLVTYGGTLKPFLGGPIQKINRLGTRFGVRFRMATMRADPEGRAWVSALAQAVEAGALMDFPQDVSVGVTGAPKVASAVAGGSLLPIKGLPAGYSIKDGAFFSIIHSGRRYLHMFAAGAVADGSGAGTALIFPMLRTSLSVNDVIEIEQPKIQGLVDGDFSWDILRLPLVQLPEFTVMEAQ